MTIPQEIRRALEQAKQQGQIAPEAADFIITNFDAVRFGVCAGVAILFAIIVLAQFSDVLGFLALPGGIWIAYQIWRNRKMASPRTPQPTPSVEPRQHVQTSSSRDAAMGVPRPGLAGAPVGIVLALGMGALLWFVAPESRAFVLGALVGGVILIILEALFRYWSR